MIDSAFLASEFRLAAGAPNLIDVCRPKANRPKPTRPLSRLLVVRVHDCSSNSFSARTGFAGILGESTSASSGDRVSPFLPTSRMRPC